MRKSSIDTKLLEKISLRPAKESDLETLLKWRNDPITRRYSFNEQKISLNEHKKWFNEILSSDKKLLLVVLKDKKKVGQVRFDMNDTEAEINVTIAPGWRGKGLGSCTIHKSCEYLFKEKSKIKKVNAKIKRENITSIKAFSNARFRGVRSHLNIVEMSYKSRQL